MHEQYGGNHDDEEAILPACRELGISVSAYGVLSRGLLSGHWTGPDALKEGDFRSHLPRFRGDNLDSNLALVQALHTIAGEKNATAAQMAIAWVLAQGTGIIPLVGARSRRRLRESLGGLDVALTSDDLARIEAAIPENAVAGERYDAAQMALLDSERTGDTNSR